MVRRWRWWWQRGWRQPWPRAYMNLKGSLILRSITRVRVPCSGGRHFHFRSYYWWCLHQCSPWQFDGSEPPPRRRPAAGACMWSLRFPGPSSDKLGLWDVIKIRRYAETCLRASIVTDKVQAYNRLHRRVRAVDLMEYPRLSSSWPTILEKSPWNTRTYCVSWP